MPGMAGIRALSEREDGSPGQARLTAVSAKLAQRRFGDLLGGDAEVLVEVLVGRAGAEAGHADEGAVGADDGVPALPDGGLDADLAPARRRSRRGGTSSGAAKNSSKQGTETTRAAMPLAASSFCASTAIDDFRAGGEDRDLAPCPRAGDDLVGAARRSGCRSSSVPAQLRQVLARQRQHARRLARFERELPAFRPSRPRRTGGTR